MLSYTLDLTEHQLAAALTARRQAIATELATREQEYQAAQPHQVGLEAMVLQHSLVRLRTELNWHDSLIQQLPELVGPAPTSSRPR